MILNVVPWSSEHSWLLPSSSCPGPRRRGRGVLQKLLLCSWLGLSIVAGSPKLDPWPSPSLGMGWSKNFNGNKTRQKKWCALVLEHQRNMQTLRPISINTQVKWWNQKSWPKSRLHLCNEAHLGTGRTFHGLDLEQDNWSMLLGDVMKLNETMVRPLAANCPANLMANTLTHIKGQV